MGQGREVLRSDGRIRIELAPPIGLRLLLLVLATKDYSAWFALEGTFILCFNPRPLSITPRATKNHQNHLRVVFYYAGGRPLQLSKNLTAISHEYWSSVFMATFYTNLGLHAIF